MSILTSPVAVDEIVPAPDAAAAFELLPPRPHRFLLESAGGPPDLCRHTFIGCDPFLRLIAKGRRVQVIDGGRADRFEADPLALLDALLQQRPAVPAPGLPPFVGGAVGYFAYDLGRLIERLPGTPVDDLGLPDLHLCFYDHVLAIDHRSDRAWALALPLPGREETAFAGARELGRAARRAARARARDAIGPGEPSRAAAPDPEAVAGLRSNFTPQAYRNAVARAIEYVYAGDIFQVNLAQRFTAPLPCSPWALYRRLRSINPAPFAAFLDAGEFQVISASPERFLRVDPAAGRRVETRPIKGTRPRGATPERDLELAEELVGSEKDRAELNMIVDLERNDLGRVCEIGTVRVPEVRRLEAYPTVFHTVATVEGILRPGVGTVDLLRATFPGGSITGAPKVRAMEIIDELEPVRRGVYCGAIGYLGFDGAIDLNIAIRTMVAVNGQVHFHAGGGIVADSDPQAEFEETLAKARALMQALGMAREAVRA